MALFAVVVENRGLASRVFFLPASSIMARSEELRGHIVLSFRFCRYNDRQSVRFRSRLELRGKSTHNKMIGVDDDD